MINKKEKEVKELNMKNKELKQYNLVCKKRQEELDNFAEFLKEVLAQDTISDISMRMVVNKILVHQNEDKTLDIKFEMNGRLETTKRLKYLSKNQKTGVKFTSVFLLREDMKQIIAFSIAYIKTSL